MTYINWRSFILTFSMAGGFFTRSGIRRSPRWVLCRNQERTHVTHTSNHTQIRVTHLMLCRRFLTRRFPSFIERAYAPRTPIGYYPPSGDSGTTRLRPDPGSDRHMVDTKIKTAKIASSSEEADIKLALTLSRLATSDCFPWPGQPSRRLGPGSSKAASGPAVLATQKLLTALDSSGRQRNRTVADQDRKLARPWSLYVIRRSHGIQRPPGGAELSRVDSRRRLRRRVRRSPRRPGPTAAQVQRTH